MEESWAVHEVINTASFAPRSRILSWFIGGLNYQIEHHLFTGVCHVHYKKNCVHRKINRRRVWLALSCAANVCKSLVGSCQDAEATRKRLASFGGFLTGQLAGNADNALFLFPFRWNDQCGNINGKGNQENEQNAPKRSPLSNLYKRICRHKRKSKGRF